jgi:hypothetical protein
MLLTAIFWGFFEQQYHHHQQEKKKINTKNSGQPKFAPLVARTSLGPKYLK